MEITAPSPSRSVTATAEAQPKSAARLLFVDNIRVFLTILVILHHLMITYTGAGDWYYSEGRQDLVSAALGLWFCALNQAYFMGLFLLISAYFVPGSYDRKGPGRFLKDRMIRLGIPLALFSWVINPLFVYAGHVLADGLEMPLWRYYVELYFRQDGPIIGGGPLWFVEVLLIFSLVYILCRLATGRRPIRPPASAGFPGTGAILVFAVLLGVVGFLVRLWHPMGWTYRPLNLQFPFFAQYIALFILGLVAYRRNWLSSLPDATGRFWLRIAGVLAVLWWLGMLLGGALESDTPFRGGWYWQAISYALWESLFCVSMCIGVIYAFRRYLNRKGKVSAFLVPNAYTAYIIHAPVITTLAFAVRDVQIYPLLKWAVVSLVALLLCFGLSALIRKLPYSERVL